MANPGGISTGALEWLKSGDISGLSDGSSLLSWPASTGAAFAQATSARYPVYRSSGGPAGDSYVDFAGSQGLYTSSISSAAGSYHVFAVIRVPSDLTANYWLLDSQTGRLVFAANLASPVGVGFYDGAFVSAGANPVADEWAIYEWQLDSNSGVGTVWVNGTEIGSAVYSAKSIGGITAIGNAYDVATGAVGGSAAGKVAEIVVFDAILGSADRLAVAADISSRSDITTAYSTSLIAADDPKILYIGAWKVGSGTAKTINSGSSFDLAFNGDAVSLHFNASIDSSGCVPDLKYSLDGGDWSDRFPAASTVVIDALRTGHHKLSVMAVGIYEGAGGQGSINQWADLQAGLEFTGVSLTDGATLLSPGPIPYEIEFVGDSITATVRLLGVLNTDQHAMDSQQGWPQLVALGVGCRAVVRGFGGTGLTQSGSGGVPDSSGNFPYCFSGVEYSPTENPRAVVVLLGTNDGASSDSSLRLAYGSLISQIRAARGATTPIICIAPPACVDRVTNGVFAGAVADVGDANVHYLDASGTQVVNAVGTANSDSYEGTHFSVAGGQKFAAWLIRRLLSILPTYEWFVLEENGGSIDTSGNYTAPESAGTFHIVAVTISDPTQVGIATVEVK